MLSYGKQEPLSPVLRTMPIMVLMVLSMTICMICLDVSAEPSSRDTSRAQESRGPIIIEGDTGFTAANGVRSGDGTFQNSYKISNYIINVASGQTGITITTTDKWVDITDCTIVGTAQAGTGMSLMTANNVWLTNVTFKNLAIGYTSSGSDVFIYDSKFIDTTDSVKISGPKTYLYFSNNSIKGGTTGVYITGMYDVKDSSYLSNSLFDGITTGLYMLEGGPLEISYNTFKGGKVGLDMLNPYNLKIHHNVFSSNSEPAIRMLYSTNVVIHSNSFKGNNGTNKQASTTTSAEKWYNTSSNRGNFWSDLTAPDANQDGVVDTAYQITSAASDPYPLTKEICTSGAPGLTIYMDKSTGAAPLDVKFSSCRQGDLHVKPDDIFSWDFGDGEKSTAATPTHTFQAAGTYTVNLKEGMSGRGYLYSATATVTVTGGGAGGALAASFTTDKSTGQAPVKITFTATASGGTGPYTYLWDFGDGATAATAVADHTYTTAGAYSVLLTVTDSKSVSKKTPAQTITVTAPGGGGGQLAVSVTATPTEGKSPLNVAFVSTVTGGTAPYTYNWDFKDGQSSNQANPSHVFSKAGNYPVTVTVKDSAGAEKVVATNIVVTKKEELKKGFIPGFEAMVFIIALGSVLVAIGRKRR